MKGHEGNGVGWGVREVQKGKRTFLLYWEESCVSGVWEAVEIFS